MYEDFALIYDKLMEDFPYEDYERTLLSLLIPRGKILEIGCGTGRMTSFFFRSGAEVHALDPSVSMLSLAKRRLPGVNFYLGNLEELQLGKFDQVYACVDIVNYYLDVQGLADFLKSVRDRLKDDFFFDLRHPQAMEDDLAGRIFFYEDEKADLVWINEKEGELLYQELVIYWKEGESYKKSYENHVQRIWLAEEVEALLGSQGLYIKKKIETRERIFYLCGLTDL